MPAGRLTIDADEAHEELDRLGWTDGLPVVAPTIARVDALLATTPRRPEDVLGTVPERHRHVTVEKAAVNAVLAGCRPEHFPFVVAAVEAMLDPAYNAHTALSSTGGAAVCVIVSGPGAARIGMNASNNALASGNRANATIGRAVRLVAANVLGAKTGEMDGASLGHPGKYTLCFAEQLPPDPWRPLAVELGFDESATVAIVMATEGPRQVANHLNPSGEGVLQTFATAMRTPSTFIVGRGGQVVLVLGYEHRTALLRDGWTRRAVQDYLVEESRILATELPAAGLPLENPGTQHPMVPGEDGRLASVTGPDDILLVTAGGAGAGWSAYLPSWAPRIHTRFVVRQVVEA
jgi:hypothetical protein